MKEFVAEVRELIHTARSILVQRVDLIQVLTNFEIGRRIVEYEQGGQKRAGYGKEVLKALSAALTKEFGRGFSHRNLEYMRKFYFAYSERIPQISQTVSAKLSASRKARHRLTILNLKRSRGHSQSLPLSS